MRCGPGHSPCFGRVISTSLLLLALGVLPGCALFKHNHAGQGRIGKEEKAQGISTNDFASSVSAEAEKSTNATVAVNAPPDNTAQNKKEAQTDTLTPLDQGDSDSDRRITQELRREVVRGDGQHHFSFAAKNIKIITVNGEVTLRGVVANASEIAAIQGLAEKLPGVRKVNNQLKPKH